MRRISFLVLILMGLADAGCSGDLQQIRRTDLLDAPAEYAPQGTRPQPQPGYAADLAPSSEWTVHGSLEGLEAVTDGDLATAAVTPRAMGRDQWLLLDLGRPCRFQGVRQRHPAAGGFARRFRVDTAGPKGYPWTLQHIGTGAAGGSEAVFRKPVEARFLRITVLEEGDPRWAVAELELF